MIRRNWKHALGIAGGLILLLILCVVSRTITPSDIVLTITAVILFSYTIETNEMRKEMVNQTKIFSSPFISVFIGTPSEERYSKLLVKNDGEVSARNIQLRPLNPLDFTFDEKGGKKRRENVSSFCQVDTLAKAETKELEIEWKFETQLPFSGLTHVFLTNQRLKSRDAEIIFKLRFENIFNDIYSADIILKNEKFVIKNFKRGS